MMEEPPPSYSAVDDEMNYNAVDDKRAESAENTSYKYRYVNLLLFLLYSTLNAFQLVIYLLVWNTSEYKGAYQLIYIPILLSSMGILSWKGIRSTILISSFASAVGSWMTIAPNRFDITMIGQTIVAASQIFILIVPPKLASDWFPSKQIATACSVAFAGNLLGYSLTYFLPAKIFENSHLILFESSHNEGMNVLLSITSTLITVIFFLLYFLFKDSPQKGQVYEESFFESIKLLLKNNNYLLHLVTTCINVGVFLTLTTLMQPIYHIYYPTEEKKYVQLSLTGTVAGIFGIVTCGILLDLTKRFKQVVVTLHVLSFLTMISYTFMYELNQVWLLFLIVSFLGFFMIGLQLVSFQFASHLTYPGSEVTSTGLIFVCTEMFAIILFKFGTTIFYHHSDKAANIFLSICLLLAAFGTGFIKANNKNERSSFKLHSLESENQPI